MEPTINNIPVTSALRLIEEARDAELCRNIDRMRSALEPVWPDIEADPELSDLPEPIAAEIYRLAGFFLSFCGKCRSVKNYQLRGKNLITKAITSFQQLGRLDMAAEASVMLALCYWYAGEIEESYALLCQIENDFDGNELHPVYLQIRLNKLMLSHTRGEYKAALELVNAISPVVRFCTDKRLLTLFHNQAGIVYRDNDHVNKADFHFNEAIRIAESAHNYNFLAINLNNLAHLYNDFDRYDQAHVAIDRSISLFEDLDDIGWIPHALDTKATIYLRQSRYEDALCSITTAITMFRSGEDMAGLCEALFTKVRCLLSLGRASEAFETYGEIHSIAARHMGEAASKRYASSLVEELSNKPVRHDAPTDNEILTDINIAALVDIDNYKFSLEGENVALKAERYYCGPEVMSSFGFNDSSVVLVNPEGERTVGNVFLYTSDGRYHLAVLQFEHWTKFDYFVDPETDFPVMLSDVQVVGHAIGYCPIDLLDEDGDNELFVLTPPAEF